MGESYAGTKIPKLSELLDFAKKTNLYIMLEIESSSISNSGFVRNMLNEIKKYNMESHVVFTCFEYQLLYIVGMMADFKPVLCLNVSNSFSVTTDVMNGLLRFTDNAYCLLANSLATSENIATLKSNGIKAGQWLVDSLSDALDCDPYIKFFTSNQFNAETELYDSAMS